MEPSYYDSGAGYYRFKSDRRTSLRSWRTCGRNPGVRAPHPTVEKRQFSNGNGAVVVLLPVRWEVTLTMNFERPTPAKKN